MVKWFFNQRAENPGTIIATWPGCHPPTCAARNGTIRLFSVPFKAVYLVSLPTSLSFKPLLHTPASGEPSSTGPPTAVGHSFRPCSQGLSPRRSLMANIAQASKTFLTPSVAHDPEQVPSLTYSSTCSEGRRRIINSKCVEVLLNTKDGKEKS